MPLTRGMHSGARSILFRPHEAAAAAAAARRQRAAWATGATNFGMFSTTSAAASRRRVVEVPIIRRPHAASVGRNSRPHLLPALSASMIPAHHEAASSDARGLFAFPLGAAAVGGLLLLGSSTLLDRSENDDSSPLYLSPFENLRIRTALCEAEPSSSSSEPSKKGKKKSKKASKTKADAAARKTSLTPSKVAHEDFEQVQESHDVESMPTYTMDEVSVNNGDDGRPVWMTYGGYVYNVTEFIANHPGGSEKIRLASGGAIEPFWYLYRQHYASDLPMRLMEHMVIGKLRDEDQDEVDAAMAQFENSDDPYAKEPSRHKALIVHSDTPMNAEVPSHVLTKSYITPTSLFYIRHHHPFPLLTEDDEKKFALELDLSECAAEGDSSSNKKKVIKISLDELRKLPKTTVTATLQCSGNRRSQFNQVERTSGTPWGQGAISTSTFGGVRLTDLLKHVGITDPVQLQQERGINHVVFTALDGMSASIGIEKAMNPFGDVIVCWEQNGELLSRDHGYPLRIVVPGYAAVRNVKWVHKIQLSANEADGPWQRGLNYKTLPPGVTNASSVNLDEMPSMTEVAVFSGITNLDAPKRSRVNPGDTVEVRASGWAWAGGGRNVVRVDVTPDDGDTWHSAEITQGRKQPFGRAWAWVFWEVTIPEVKIRADGTVQLASKAVDLAHNVQPETAKPMWNVRGLGNNSWYRAAAKVVDVL